MNVMQKQTQTQRNWQIRPATADEGPRIVHMIRAAFTPNAKRFELDATNSPGHPSNYDAERFTKDVNLGRRFFVVDDRSEAIGVMAVREVGDGTVELSRVAVDPNRQGEGFGQMLVVYAIVWAHEHEADRVDLTLLAPDHALRQWYKAIGFDVVDTHCVGAVALPAAVMSRPLTEAGVLRPQAATNDVVHTCA